MTDLAYVKMLTATTSPGNNSFQYKVITKSWGWGNDYLNLSHICLNQNINILLDTGHMNDRLFQIKIGLSKLVIISSSLMREL